MKKEKKPIPGARLIREVKEYKLPAFLSPVFTICCVFLEILIPYLTASIIDKSASHAGPKSRGSIKRNPRSR